MSGLDQMLARIDADASKEAAEIISKAGAVPAAYNHTDEKRGSLTAASFIPIREAKI